MERYGMYPKNPNIVQMSAMKNTRREDFPLKAITLGGVGGEDTG